MKLTEPPMTMSEIDPDTSYTNVSEILYAYCAERDETLCALCSHAGSELHHIIYKSQGGKHKPNNLVTLCKDCHLKVHNGDYGKQVKTVLLRVVKMNDRKFRRRL